MRFRGTLPLIAAGLVAFFGCTLSTSWAQTDAGGLLAPWPTGLSIESKTDAILENAGHVKENDAGLRLGTYQSQGRWKLLNEYKINPTVGYDAFYLDINSRDPRLPRHLLDASVGFGSPIAKFGDWFFAASGAVGYAGNAPMSQSSAYYGKATLLAGKELGPDSNLIIGLDYNGNRADFPDLPIPGFVYTKRIYATLLAAVGFPYSTITWTPTQEFTLEARYSFPQTIDIQATYKLTRQIGVFANYVNTEKAFHVEDFPHNRRLFFEQQRAELGVRYEPIANVALLAGAGYAFNTKFNIGFNALDAGNLLHSSDEAYVRLGVEVRH